MSEKTESIQHAMPVCAFPLANSSNIPIPLANNSSPPSVFSNY